MSGMSLLFIGFIFVIMFAVVFFGAISKRSEQDSARVDRLIDLNGLSERKKMEKFTKPVFFGCTLIFPNR